MTDKQHRTGFRLDDALRRAVRKWLSGAGRFARHVGTYLGLFVLAGVGLVVAGHVARMLGFSGNQTQLVRFVLLGLYVVTAVLISGSSKH